MKLKRFLLLLAFVGMPTFAAYQRQGFDQFQEFDGNMTFSCTTQCIALIGPIAGSDFATLKGSLQGNGVIGYGFLVGQQITPGESLQLNGPAMVDQQFSFSVLPYFSQLPSEAQLVLVVQGNVSGLQVSLQPGFMGFFQKIGKGRKDFRVREKYGYYSINLLYGPKILGKSFVSMWNIWYAIALSLGIVYLLMNKKKQKIKQYFIYLSIVFFAIVGLRFLYDSYGMYRDDLQLFVNPPLEKKIFRNYNDIYTFGQFIQSNVSSGSTVLFVSYQERPYPEFAKYQLRPDIKVDIRGRKDISSDPDFVAVYDVGRFSLNDGNLLDTTTNAVVLSGMRIVKQYNQFSYILEKF